MGVVEYAARFPGLEQVAAMMATLIRDLLGEMPRIDRVSARAKSPTRFAAKAVKVDDNGVPCYEDPLSQIQDQIGARVVVFYKSDVETVGKVVEQYFRTLESEEHVPDSYWEFGYFGRHWIFPLPGDVIPMDVEEESVPRFFELQVKTLFQHAWSEGNHDVAYNRLPNFPPTSSGDLLMLQLKHGVRTVSLTNYGWSSIPGLPPQARSFRQSTHRTRELERLGKHGGVTDRFFVSARTAWPTRFSTQLSAPIRAPFAVHPRQAARKHSAITVGDRVNVRCRRRSP